MPLRRDRKLAERVSELENQLAALEREGAIAAGVVAALNARSASRWRRVAAVSGALFALAALALLGLYIFRGTLS
jgi:hypothetical protein